MGGKDTTEVKTIIKNKIQIEIDNTTKNITRIMNKTITNVTNEMTQSASAEVSQTTGGSNTFSADSLVAKGKGSKNTFEQDLKVSAVNNALISILQDGQQMQEMANKMAQDVKNKTQQDAEAKAAMDTTSKIGQLSKENGGPEGVVNKLADMVGGMTKSLTGGSTDSKTDTQIENDIRQSIKNTTINENDISTIIESSIKSSVNQNTAAACKLNTTASNVISVKDILAIDGGENEVKQKVDITAVNTCIINLQIGSKMATQLSGGFSTTTSSETKQEGKAESKLKAESEITKTTIQESAIMNTVDGIVGVVGGWGSMFMIVAGIAVLGAIFLFATGAISPSDFTPGGALTGALSDFSDQDGGGLDSQVYIFAATVAFLILVARKSIPLCGAILIIIFIYFLNKTKPELFSS